MKAFKGKLILIFFYADFYFNYIMPICNYNYPCHSKKSDSVKEMGYIYSHMKARNYAFKQKFLCDCGATF